jgi:deoxyribodipyrimidine photo-lyase
LAAPARLERPATLPADDPPPGEPASEDQNRWAAAWLQEPGQVGEQAAISRLHAFIDGALARYAVARDLPDQQGTSMLSPHLAFGEISARQIWHTVRTAGEFGGDPFLRELAWRDFFWQTLIAHPDLPDAPLKPLFADFPWAGDDGRFAAWTAGRTGYPIVDAGMRALASTGWLHNRVRMLVASFLVKDLLLPWQSGEAWFWDRLVDADLACNAGNWQWVAGCGLDAAPYFRIFNPVLQGEKFDARGRFLRRWVPELARLPDMFIHRPAAAPPDVLARAGVRLSETYPQPLVDHGTARHRALAAYEQIRGLERFPMAERQG